MDEFTVDAFVNRDDPVPVVALDQHGDFSGDEEGDAESRSGTRRKLRDHLSKSNMTDRFRKATGKPAEPGRSMQDRLLEKYVLGASNSVLLWHLLIYPLIDCCSR